MATIYTHAIVGLGAARLCTPRPMPWTFWGLAAVLPVLPDLDVFSTAAYGPSSLGHRGITHSLAFALLVGVLAASVTFRRFRANWWLLAGLFSAIIASHGLLDALTRGGGDVEFFWPFSARCGNWGPIPVSDLGFELPDPRHSRALRFELLWIWLPGGTAVALVSVWRWLRRRQAVAGAARLSVLLGVAAALGWLAPCRLGAGEIASVSSQAPTETTNTIGIKLVLVPAGEFMMGGQEPAEQLVRAFAVYQRKPEEFADEYPRHRVRITRPFYLGKHEVTVGQFRRFVAATGYRTEAEKDGEGGWGYNPAIGHSEGRKPQYNWRNPGFPQTDDHPVVNVTWNDAVAFCDWLGHKEKAVYRLPTEAEWEYACRAGTGTRYSYGDDPDRLPQMARVTEARGRTSFPAVQNLVIPPGEAGRFTAVVGSFPANRLGLHDMHGNVWEWCSDWYGADYYARSPRDDPKGPDAGDRRVRRGGAWNSFPLWPRASFRNWNTPVSRCVNLGFRVVKNVSAEPTPPTR